MWNVAMIRIWPLNAVLDLIIAPSVAVDALVDLSPTTTMPARYAPLPSSRPVQDPERELDDAFESDDDGFGGYVDALAWQPSKDG